MRIPITLLLALALAPVAARLGAQSLADLARQEEARRKETKQAGKVYTNKDLKPVPPAPSQTPSSAGQPAPDSAAGSPSPRTASAESKPAADAPPRAGTRDREYWNRRITESREQLDRDRTLVEALQTRINSLTTDFVNRDDPAARAEIERERMKALAELDRLKKAVDEDVKAIAALEEEARRAGVPPGWLR